VAAKTVATAIYARYFRMRSAEQKQQRSRGNAAKTNQPLHALPRSYRVDSKLDLWINKSCGINWINKGQKFDKLIKCSINDAGL
jgi:hypothetical protein